MYLRRLLLAIFVFGSVGVVAELLLLGHFEDALQFVPLVLLAVGVAVGVWHWTQDSSRSTRALQVVLAAFALSGGVGIWLHYSGNVEFEIERDPELGGLGLFAEAMTGATPALAPGTMVLLAAIGFAALRARDPR